MQDLAAITCYFNYTKNPHLINCFKKFRDNLKRQGVQLFVIELAFEKENFSLPKEDTFLRMRTESVLWHKETLLNKIAKSLPEHITKIAWLDCDILIENDNWVEETSKLLNQHKILQIGSVFRFLNEDGSLHNEQKSLGFAFSNGDKNPSIGFYHCGLAWAASRDFFDKCGLFEYDFSGSGDGSVAVAVIGNKESRSFSRVANSYRVTTTGLFEIYHNYVDKVQKYNGKNFGSLDATVTHLYHAPMEGRNYSDRPFAMYGLDFNKDIERDKNGLIKILNKKIENQLKDFLVSKDDFSRGHDGDGKIFFIGFPKTGTVSLYYLFGGLLGYKTVHAGVFDHRSELGEQRFASKLMGGRRDLLLDYWDVFLDCSYISDNFEFLYEKFPDAKFIFNTRDYEDWIKSFRRHFEQIDEEQRKKFNWYNFNEETLKRRHDQHTKNVLDFFEGKDNFLVLNICGGDGYNKLCPFLKIDEPSFSIPHLHRRSS